MPSYLFPLNRASAHEPPIEAAVGEGEDHISQVVATSEAEDAIAELHRTITGRSGLTAKADLGGPFAGFEEYLRRDEQSGASSVPLSVCFKGVTTYGKQEGATGVKTLKDALLRTFTLQEIYEWTLKRVISPDRVENGRALIRDFTGVVRNGEMMLWVLTFPYAQVALTDHGSLAYSATQVPDAALSCERWATITPPS